MQKKWISILVIVPSILFANDTFLGSVSGNPFPAPNYFFPSKAENIQMVKERIYVKMFKDSCQLKCQFWFYNSGKEDTVIVGFPDYMQTEGDNGDSLRNFKCLLNKKKVHHSFTKQLTYQSNRDSLTNNDPWQNFYWFTWEAVFKSKDTTYIENTFTANMGKNSLGGKLFYYFIGSGASWQGPIADGVITFDYSDFLSNRFIREDKELKHKFIKGEDSLVVAFKDYRPDRMERIGLEFYYGDDFWNIDKIQYDDLRLMRNEIFARHGYVFKDSILSSYFSRKKWYKPNLRYSDSMLSKDEMKMVKKFDESDKNRPTKK